MQKVFSRWQFLAVVATVFCGSLFSTNAYAEKATYAVVPIVDVSFNPSLCGSLTATNVTLNGAYFFTFRTHKNENGTYTTKIRSIAFGTAVDENGQDYIFDYFNNEKAFSSTPALTPPYVFSFTDRFNLFNAAGTPVVSESFDLVGSIDAQGNFTLISLVTKKGSDVLYCDPI